jgi:membrane AbrB-like protein
MAPPTPLRRTVLQTAETLLLATVGGVVFMLVGFPAGLISGSLLVVAAAGLLGRPMHIPRHLSQAIMMLVGISLGAVVTPETLKGLAAFPVSIAVLSVATICMTIATTSYLRFVHKWDARSALLGASPGALAQVMALSAEFGADMRKIAIVQVVRVVILTIGIPTGLAFFGLAASGAGLPTIGRTGSLLELVILVAVSVGTGIGLLKSRFPGGLIFGSMMGSAVLHGGGFIEAALPSWVVAAAVVGIGAVTGSRFANTDPRTLLRYLGAALGSFAVAISIASAFALLLTMLLSVRIADVVVAFSPGAQDTMMVMALALHLDPIFVGAHHLARYILVSLFIPLFARRLGSPKEDKPSAKITETRPRERPTIED